ncbi:hypothetical protein [Aureimonas altamirensis]|uniref:hypothetical protein n=1 Tax=Aureimonas altamirensis TaxID=370622 RepID=UPI0030B9F9D7
MTETLFPRPRANMGQPVQRYEARAKVTGGADYPSDVRLARTVHAYIHTSRVARGPSGPSTLHPRAGLRASSTS